ncbi:hypothetical protein PMAYCL1PPCAC_13530, partial [Pristionchus mayeri]
MECDLRHVAWVCSLSELSDPTQGFVDERGMVTIEVSIYMTRLVGVSVRKPFGDFSIPTPSTDCVLLVDGKKFHVNKSLLATVSPVFEKMFFDDFAEKDKKE